jgi:hypothetical protein
VEVLKGITLEILEVVVSGGANTLGRQDRGRIREDAEPNAVA